MTKVEVCWQQETLTNFRTTVRSDHFWSAYISNQSNSRNSHKNIHLAIFQPPYLEYVLEGKKTVESRFSANRCAPFDKVKKGDIVLLKETGGPVVGVCLIDHVWFYNIEPDTWLQLKSTYTNMLCAHDPDFWTSRSKARFASLMKIIRPTRISPFYCYKKDRRGWVILENSPQQGLNL